MTEKRFYLDKNGINDREYEFSILGEDELVDIINELNDEKDYLKNKVNKQQVEIDYLAHLNGEFKEENKKLKLQNGELLYQIGEIGKNNKTCQECECFISKINYCYMWDMAVEADDVVVACDQRKIKKYKGDDG